jgi:hypothetical protein
MSQGQNMVRWTIVPPPGCNFRNEMGGEVTLTFEEGREGEILQCLEREIARNRNNQEHMRRYREQQLGIRAQQAAKHNPQPQQHSLAPDGSLQVQPANQPDTRLGPISPDGFIDLTPKT